MTDDRKGTTAVEGCRPTNWPVGVRFVRRAFPPLWGLALGHDGWYWLDEEGVWSGPSTFDEAQDSLECRVEGLGNG